MNQSPTIAELLDLLEKGERQTERFYLSLAEMFLHQPDAAEVWWEMASGEAHHLWLLEKAREAFTPQQLSRPADPGMVEDARRRAGIDVERLLSRIETLEDAYQTAHEVESLEFDAILEPIMLDFFPNDVRNKLARSQLEHHTKNLDRLRTAEWRRSVPARKTFQKGEAR